jgi:plasmid replication initiation protein
MKKEMVLNKPSFLINFKNEFSFIAFKLFNYALYKSIPEVGSKREFFIPANEVYKYLGTRNSSQVAKATDEMGGTAYREVFQSKKDIQSLRRTNIFGQVEFERNKGIKFTYTPEIIKYLDNPKFYAKIELLVQQNLRSKHSCRLHELCIDYKGDYSKGFGRTPKISIDKLKEYFGVSNKYKDYKILKRNIINKSIKEINEKDDSIHIELDEYPLDSKKKEHVQFVVYEIPKKPSKFGNSKDYYSIDDKILIKNILLNIGIKEVHADKWAKLYNYQYIMDSVAYLRRKEGYDIFSTAPWKLSKTLEENWSKSKHHSHHDSELKIANYG